MNIDEVRASFTIASSWQKSSRSNADGCVELNGSVPEYVGMRDSKLGADSPILVFNRDEIRAFLLGAKDGEFDHLLT